MASAEEDILREIYSNILTDVEVRLEGDVAIITGTLHHPVKYLKLTFEVGEPVLETPGGPR